MDFDVFTHADRPQTPITVYVGLGKDHCTTLKMTADEAIRYGTELIRKAEKLNATAVAEKRALELGLAALRILTAPVAVSFAMAAE